MCVTFIISSSSLNQNYLLKLCGLKCIRSSLLRKPEESLLIVLYSGRICSLILNIYWSSVVCIVSGRLWYVTLKNLCWLHCIQVVLCCLILNYLLRPSGLYCIRSFQSPEPQVYHCGLPVIWTWIIYWSPVYCIVSGCFCHLNLKFTTVDCM